MLDPITYIRKKHHYGRYERVKQLIKNKGKKLLDIGCGAPADFMRDGSFLTYLGYGQGIDIEQRNIEFEFKIGSITNIPYGSKKFDVVTAIEVMEHIDNPLVALKEIHRILKEHGTFIMTAPNNHLFFRVFWWLWERSFGKEWKYTHITFYNKKQWLSIIGQSNYFKIKRVIDYWYVNIIVEMEKI